MNPLLSLGDLGILGVIDRHIEATTAPDSRGDTMASLLLTCFGRRGPAVLDACAAHLQDLWEMRHLEAPQLHTT
ncbi:hypothetical protein AB0M95_01975 [Sphaerisporangium sp. NPDC051017]|uniref:hypothetical protein n=1 Tax=Sphaerisporangium sp. NPDC051017 TaxID=3154636 RepID=UPI0034123605